MHSIRWSWFAELGWWKSVWRVEHEDGEVNKRSDLASLIVPLGRLHCCSCSFENNRGSWYRRGGCSFHLGKGPHINLQLLAHGQIRTTRIPLVHLLCSERVICAGLTSKKFWSFESPSGRQSLLSISGPLGMYGKFSPITAANGHKTSTGSLEPILGDLIADASISRLSLFPKSLTTFLQIQFL